MRIPEVAWSVQDNVKKSVELMSGLTVGKVNVHVVGVENRSETVERAEEIVPVQDESDGETQE